MSPDLSSAAIWIGDCLRIMQGFDDGSVDLIYLDPPFNSNRNYRGSPGTPAAGAGFSDIWTVDDFDADEHRALADRNALASKVIDLAGDIRGDSMRSYLSFMAARLWEMHRILRAGGSLYLHCDPGASHYLKLILDALFGKKAFQNEIVWCYGLGGSSRKRYSRKHDVILFYAKGAQGPATFNKPCVPSTSQKMKGKPKGATDIWEIPALNNMSKERTGYPSQKPLALLERIVAASSEPGDLVLDPFCGCATTLVAADRLQRRWAGIDRSPLVAELVDRRLRADRKEWKGVSVLTDPPLRGAAEASDRAAVGGDALDRRRWAAQAPSPHAAGDARYPLAEIDADADADAEFDSSLASSPAAPAVPRASPPEALARPQAKRPQVSETDPSLASPPAAAAVSGASPSQALVRSRTKQPQVGEIDLPRG
ncbi:MAG: site-specific DNA-methyltransferase [Ectothiorhodospiraceae bacterium AqS1]|nr:site-specific DNA-methyltransferase [Ectothiorhodospiraceae bacterium AqS1]